MLAVLLLGLGLLPGIHPSYRLLSLPEVCRQSQDRAAARVTLEEGGAAVLSLSEGQAGPHWRCDLELRAGPGFGLMVHVEGARLRPSVVRQGKCQDYLQLGRDDKTPFYTWDKTVQLCGDSAEGATYDVPDGQLLVWVRLGGPSGLETSALSLVVTAYLTADSALPSDYRACSHDRRFIRRGYFCDGRTNCAADLGNPADESVSSCGSELGVSPSSLPPGPSPPLNLLTVTLVLASLAVLLLTFCVLIIRLSRSGRHCCPSPSSASPELPERHAPSQGLLRPHILLHRAPAPQPHTRGTTPDSDSEPPPAYCDLYPTGFVFAEEKISQTAACGGESPETLGLQSGVTPSTADT